MEKKKEIADYYFHNLMFDCVEERLIDITRVNSCVSLGGSCLIDIQFVLLYKKKDFTLPFFSNHCFVYACLQISFQVSQTSYFPSIYLVNAYFLLSFLPCKLQEALEESEKNAR